MAITLEQAKTLTYGDVLYHKTLRKANGDPREWRVNGKPKTWKRSPERVLVPLKYGMYGFDSLDENSLDELCMSTEEALSSE